jgi:hypothetical protein
MAESKPQTHQHPIGTLVILLVYGALFAAGWLALYFLVFVPRGPVTG